MTKLESSEARNNNVDGEKFVEMLFRDLSQGYKLSDSGVGVMRNSTSWKSQVDPSN